tara:strand:- start:797 stop:937 length:141 start_codon:yes stop_codon:yes gene_type:complete
MAIPRYPYFTKKGALRAQKRLGGKKMIKIIEFKSGDQDAYFVRRIL